VWPASPEALERVQADLAARTFTIWRPCGSIDAGACFVCFRQQEPGHGKSWDPGWAGAALGLETAVARGPARAGYGPGLLALREGPLLEEAVRSLPRRPEVLIVNATGRDHPRRCGLALHLGAVLDIPSVGITHRPLLAVGEWPVDERGATSGLTVSGEIVGYWLRTRRNARPLAVHAGWRTGPDTAVEVVLAATTGSRTPEPLRAARSAARLARSADAA
jgi:deoxyribonuclease V